MKTSDLQIIQNQLKEIQVIENYLLSQLENCQMLNDHQSAKQILGLQKKITQQLSDLVENQENEKG